MDGKTQRILLAFTAIAIFALLSAFFYSYFNTAPTQNTHNNKSTNVSEAALPEQGDITADKLLQFMNRTTPLQIVDVREPYEFAEGHIPQAKNIPLGQLESRLNELDPTVLTVVTCRSGRRSKLAYDILQKVGFKRLYNLEGGILAWKGEVVK